MYNKRVRIATEMFSELFGPDFDSIIPIYPTGGLLAICPARAAPPCPGMRRLLLLCAFQHVACGRLTAHDMKFSRGMTLHCNPDLSATP